MNRREFMNELDRRLSSFPREDKLDALNYYTEYFEDAGIGPDDNIPADMQGIDSIVSQLASECMNKMSTEKPKTVRRGVSSVWFAVLGVFAAPIAIPIVIVIAVLMFTLCITIAAVLFAGICAAAGVILGGLCCIVAAWPASVGSIFTGMFTGGTGLFLIGVGVLLLILMVYLAKWSCFAIVKISNSISKHNHNRSMAG